MTGTQFPRIPARFPTQVLDRVCAAALKSGTWCVHLELHFDESVDAARLGRAVRLMMDAEPWLGCRFIPRWPQPVWERIDLEESDCFVPVTDESEYRELQRRPLDIETGPLARVGLWSRSDDRDRVLLTMSHTICDGGGLLDGARLLASVYRALGKYPDHRPVPNLDGERAFGQILRRIPWGAYPRILSNMGRQLRQKRDAFPCHKLTIEHDGESTDTNFLVRELDGPRTSRLSRYGRERDATVNDLMLTAFVRGLIRAGRWKGDRPVSINSTIDLRRYLPGGRADAVCNLACGQLLTLGLDPGKDFEETLTRVSAINRERKASWLGLNAEVAAVPMAAAMPWGMLSRLIGKAMDKPPADGWPADSISNMGLIDPIPLAFDEPPVLVLVLPQFMRPPRYQVVCFGVRGSIYWTSGVYPSAARERAVNRLFDAMVKELPV